MTALQQTQRNGALAFCRRADAGTCRDAFRATLCDSLECDLDGMPVNLIALARLKTNTKTAGRHRDLNDLENLP